MDDVVVGRIGRAHGLRGEVSVEPRTDEPERRFADGAVLTTRGARARGDLTVAGTRTHQGRLLVRFEEIGDRTRAEEARGLELTCRVDPAETPADPEEFYDHQLVGLRVETVAGDGVGHVVRIDHGPAQDLLVIGSAHGEVLFPFVRALVPQVEVADGRIVVDDLPGLLAEREG